MLKEHEKIKVIKVEINKQEVAKIPKKDQEDLVQEWVRYYLS